jgi:hypothetical protein
MLGGTSSRRETDLSVDVVQSRPARVASAARLRGGASPQIWGIRSNRCRPRGLRCDAHCCVINRHRRPRSQQLSQVQRSVRGCSTLARLLATHTVSGSVRSSAHGHERARRRRTAAALPRLIRGMRLSERRADHRQSSPTAAIASTPKCNPLNVGRRRPRRIGNTRMRRTSILQCSGGKFRCPAPTRNGRPFSELDQNATGERS